VTALALAPDVRFDTVRMPVRPVTPVVREATARRSPVRMLGGLVLLGAGGAALYGAFLPWSVMTSSGQISIGLPGVLPQQQSTVSIVLGALLMIAGLYALVARRLPAGVWFFALALGAATAFVGNSQIASIERGNSALGSMLGGTGADGRTGLMSYVHVGLQAGLGVHLQVWAGGVAILGALLCAVRARRSA
jgi:hypothetical protein